MALRELASGIAGSSSVQKVFGEPIEKDGVLVIPVASIRGAFGGGESTPAPGGEAGPAAPAALAAGWGGGGGWSATAAGAYVLKNGEISWVPAADANRTILIGCLTGIFTMLVLRSIVRTIVKRG
jgi:uncharacterized spore protein YtfJ